MFVKFGCNYKLDRLLLFIVLSIIFIHFFQNNSNDDQIIRPISERNLKITQELVKKRQGKTSFDVRKKVKNRKALDLAKNNQVP